MSVRRGQAVFRGVRSPYLESGPRHASEAVVFVHGNPGSSEDWRELLTRVGAFARCVAPDMPGYGKADRPKDFDYTVQGYAGHLDGVMEHLGVERAHLVLHDFGGPWGLAWAPAHPERLGSVTLVNIGLMPGYRWHYVARIWRTPILGELFQATMTRFLFGLGLRHGNPRGLPGAFVDRMYRDMDRGTKRAILRLYRATHHPGAMAERLGPLFRELDVPALVIWGAADPYVPVRYAEQQRQFFPSARVVVLEKSGHWPFIDDPESVAQQMIPFLREHIGVA
ncbi:MAG TPA: alpha/beta hydrolase [Dehalococcoidia bacterium]|nr:alpha/beta hydrolase [Dehalococcoidia bacterium]